MKHADAKDRAAAILEASETGEKKRIELENASLDNEYPVVDAYIEDKLSSETEAMKVSDNDNKETTTEKTYLEDKLTSEIGASRYNSVVDMMLKALWNIKVFREEMRQSRPIHSHNHLEERCVPCVLQNLFSSFAKKQINDEELYRYLLNDLITALDDANSMASDGVELLMSVLEFLHYWKSPRQRESLVTRLFTVEEFERMSCNRCRREPNYPEQSSYGLNICANSIKEYKFALEFMKFEEILKAIRMNFQMYCDTKTGGCGKRNYVSHDMTRCPAIFIIALEWEKNETGEEICATTTALDTEIDISALYKGIDPMTNYRLVSMIGCRGEEEYSCIAYENKRWVRHDASVKEDIGDWNNVISFCRERVVRPQILFFEATCWPNKP